MRPGSRHQSRIDARFSKRSVLLPRPPLHSAETKGSESLSYHHQIKVRSAHIGNDHLQNKRNLSAGANTTRGI